MLPSTFDDKGRPSARQHLTCVVIDDAVAIDAGSLALSFSPDRFHRIRDVVLTHAHLDHIAGLPLFIDDLFATLTEPVRIHAAREVIDVLERDVFNWSVYPRFSELVNSHGPVIEYRPFEYGRDFGVRHLTVRAIPVNHKVPSAGFLIGDGRSLIAMTGDTAAIDEFWKAINTQRGLSALMIECAFPDELQDLAEISHHLTPSGLRSELSKFELRDCPIFIVNIKPMYREETISQISKLGLPGVEILEVGRIYEW